MQTNEDWGFPMAQSDESSGMVLLTGNSHPQLAALIAEHLQTRLGDAVVYNKPNRETQVEIRQSVRDKHVFIIQSTSKNVNNDIWEMLILMYTCKTSSAKSINVIMPFLPYSRQCCISRRSAIPMKLVADMICKAGATRLVSLDLYRKEIQGFFGIPVDNLRASPFLIHYICHNIPDYKNAIIVAKTPKVMHKATSYANRLRLGVAVIHGEVKDSDKSSYDARQSPPRHEKDARNSGSVLTYELFPKQVSKEKPPLTVVGDVGGKIAIIIDDVIDEAYTFVAAAQVLKERGAYKIYVVATHGILSGDAPAQIEESIIDEVIVSNTVPHEVQKLRCHKIRTVDISLLLSDVIRRIYNKESIGQLFRQLAL